MAKRRGGGVHRYGKFTPARRAALKKAAYISAKKRHARRKQRIKVGVLVASVAGAGALAYAGQKTGVNKQVANSVKNFKPKAAINNARNRAAAALVVSPNAKEKVRKQEAISPAFVKRKRTVIDPVDPQKVRDKDTPYREPGHFQRVDEDTLEIIDKTDKYLPRELVKGRKIKQSTIQKALDKQAEAVGGMGVKSGETAVTTKEGQKSIIDAMVADGTVRKATRGRRTAQRKNPKATRRRGTGPSGLTEAQMRAALAFDVPVSSGVPVGGFVKPTKSVPAAKTVKITTPIFGRNRGGGIVKNWNVLDEVSRKALQDDMAKSSLKVDEYTGQIRGISSRRGRV